MANSLILCSVHGCENRHSAKGMCKMHYSRFIRYGTTERITQMHMPLETRFWSRATIAAGCWIWTGATNNRGYGQIREKRRVIYTHRLSWELAKGAIPDGLEVLHSCDNPPCCNPAHLFLGTQADNMRDCSDKGRVRFPAFQGERHWKAKLSEQDIRAIRAARAAGVFCKVLAESYRVDATTISDIATGKSWKHIP